MAQCEYCGKLLIGIRHDCPLNPYKQQLPESQDEYVLDTNLMNSGVKRYKKLPKAESWIR